MTTAGSDDAPIDLRGEPPGTPPAERSAPQPDGANGTEAPRRPGWRVWWEAARPRTLPASVAPVLIGTAAASSFLAGRFVLALIVALALQVGVNYANDYFDGVAGVDTGARVGPRRAVASGQVPAGHMRNAMVLALGVAALSGLGLAVLAGWELLIVGALALVAAVAYSGGPRPYASAGLGELFVFVFFGLVATVGSAYVQDERIVPLAVVAAFLPGLLAVALLMVNNLRDIPTDEATGKRTLAVRIGATATRRAVVVCVVGAFLAPIAVGVMTRSLWPLLTAVALPLAARVVVGAGGAEGRRLVILLGQTGRLLLVAGIPFAIALWLA